MAIRALRQHRVEFTPHLYDWEPRGGTRASSQALGVDEHLVIKTLIFELLQSSGEEGIRVCTGKDLYRITRIKPDNGRNMTAGEFVRGHHIAPDARFG